MAITAAMVKELREATGAGILDSKKALEASNGDFDKSVEFLREKGLAKAAKKASREVNEGVVTLRLNSEATAASMIEVNCETDFVARNESFQAFVDNLIDQVAKTGVDSVESLMASEYQAEPGKTVSQAITETISTIGENIVVGNLAQHTLEGPGLIEGYIHFGGRVGVLVDVVTEKPAEDQEKLVELAHDLALQIAAVRPGYIDKGDIPEAVIENERKVFLAQLTDDNKPDHIKARIVEGRLNKFYQENCLMNQAFVKDDSLTIEKLLKQYSKALATPITVSKFSRFEIGG